MTQQLPPGAVRPGWTTSGFWQTLLVHMIAAVITLGTVFHAHFNLNGLQAIVPSIAVLSSAVAQSMYSHSRATVKIIGQAAAIGAQQGAASPGHPAVDAEPAPIVVKVTGIQPRSSISGGESLIGTDAAKDGADQNADEGTSVHATNGDHRMG